MATGKNQISRFAAIFAGGTLASRGVGLVRDVVILPLLPTGPRDAFLFAFKLPNMLRDMLGEGAVNAAFVPTFTACLEKESRTAFKELVAACFGAMIVVFSMLTVLGVLLMPLLPALLEAASLATGAAPKDPAQVTEWVRMLQWTFPYLFFIGLAVFAMGPLFAVQKYAAPAWSPVLLNIALILCAWFLHDHFENPAWALIIGVWAGGIAQLIWMIAAMRRHTGVLFPSFRLFHPGVKHAFWLLVPVILGQAAGEVNKIVDSLFALDIGAVSYLFAANRLIQLPLALFGMAVAVAVLPALTRAAVREDHRETRQILSQGLRQSAFLLLPAMAGLFTLGLPVIRLLLLRNEWTEEDAQNTAEALYCSAPGLVFFAWARISAQAYYARHDTRTPVIIATCSMLLNLVLNIFLVGPLGFHGLAIATTISFAVNALVLLSILRRRNGPLFVDKDWRAFAAMLLATLFSAGAALGTRMLLESYTSQSGFIPSALDVFPALFAAITVYGLACHLLRVEDLRSVLGVLMRRRR